MYVINIQLFIIFHQTQNIYIAPPDLVNEALIFPNSEVHVIEGSGNCVQWEKQELVNPLIWSFVSDRPGRRYQKSFKTNFGKGLKAGTVRLPDQMKREVNASLFYFPRRNLVRLACK